MAKYLSKSRYKIGRECPTKLYYHSNKDTYSDNNIGDPFLTALAEGGFQVGELAKLHFPDGTNISTLDHKLALEQTKIALQQNPIHVYEPAFLYENFFVRVDILVQNKNVIELIEVKSKSFDPHIENPFWQKTALKKGKYKIDSAWESYLYDIAFQTYVVTKAHPEWKIKSYLMLANKTAKATVDGLNQMFRIYHNGDRTEARAINGLKTEDLGASVLIKVDVSEIVDKIINDQIERLTDELSFTQEINILADSLVANKKLPSPIGSKCKTCQFRCEESTGNLKSGFHECWSQVKRNGSELNGPFVFDIWNFRKASDLIESGIFLAKDIKKEDISPTANSEKSGLSMTERQWEQIESIKNSSTKPVILKSELKNEMLSWQFPLHFIDFETSMVALPFNKGRTPYEQIAFQFSHHVLNKDGSIEHIGEYLNRKKGFFPNFEFARELKRQLSADNGTIFRYAAHENTVLCQIYDQLLQSSEFDKDELCQWIRTITQSNKSSTRGEWEGDRNMVDLCELVKQYYYDPQMGGSNSIKKVLPAILNSSKFLQEKYAKAIYGSPVIKSKNFSNMKWIEVDENGSIKNPYKLLPSIFNGYNIDDIDLLINNDQLADGGAAMTAYAQMQFMDMTELESEAVAKALLKYCELDTLAMVMIWEFWADEVGLGVQRKSA